MAKAAFVTSHGVDFCTTIPLFSVLGFYTSIPMVLDHLWATVLPWGWSNLAVISDAFLICSVLWPVSLFTLTHEKWIALRLSGKLPRNFTLGCCFQTGKDKGPGRTSGVPTCQQSLSGRNLASGSRIRLLWTLDSWRLTMSSDSLHTLPTKFILQRFSHDDRSPSL